MSTSAPGAISDELPKQKPSSNESSNNSLGSGQERRQRLSKDSAMEVENENENEHENCRSLSGFTDSTEQSAPVNFDMSNRVRTTCFLYRNFKLNSKPIKCIFFHN